MNRTREIKEIIGSVLEEKGIKYLRKEHGIVWNFERKSVKLYRMSLFSNTTNLIKNTKFRFGQRPEEMV